jgi:hypothetical protein
MIAPKRRKQEKVFDALERPGPIWQGFTLVEATPRQVVVLEFMVEFTGIGT